jgi:outer membrane protein OmpA-like peptidoglycan-associated protein
MSLSRALSLILLFLPCMLLAQPDPASDTRPRYGIVAGVNINRHDADIRALPGVPNCCPRFQTGTGIGFSGGVFYQFSIGAPFSIWLRGSYMSHDGSLSEIERETFGVNGEPVAGEIEHSVDAMLGTIGLEPMLDYRITGGLSAMLGARAGFLFRRNYEQREELLTPTTGTFNNGSRIRNADTGIIGQTNRFNGSLLGGLSYEIPLNPKRTMILAPEVLLSYGLTNLVKDSLWKIHSLRIGVALKFAPDPDRAFQNPEVTGLAAQVRAVGLDEDGKEYPDVTVRIEEFTTNRVRPLLNYVFFDPDTSEIPYRYRTLTPEAIERFQIDQLSRTTTLEMYHHVLDIVGRRMLQNPDATITLVGTNSNDGSEKGNRDLSRRRAEAVRDYLQRMWKIDNSRMRVELRNLPDKPSNINDPDGVVENRRVEIYASNPKILEPVYTTDIERTANPPSIRFYPGAQADAGVDSWIIRARQNGRVLREISGIGAVPPTVDWNLERDQASMPNAPQPMQYELQVNDRNGQTYTTPLGEIPLNQVTIETKRKERIADREIDRFSLILFDFNTSELNDANRQAVDYIKKRITLASTVTISGYTDRIGDPAHNLQLSKDRAQSTFRAIGFANAKVNARGETELHDNDLPEGRFYSRTVDVVIERPIER